MPIKLPRRHYHRVREKFEKTAFSRYMLTQKAFNNLQEILEKAKESKSIFLSPQYPGYFKSSVEHYYHFIFDLLFPLVWLCNRSRGDITFLLEEVGPLSSIIRDIYPNRIRFVSKQDGGRSNQTSCPLIGLDPYLLNITRSQLMEFRETIFKKYKIEACSKPNKVLLIERIPPCDFYKNNAVIKGSGSLRRSIINHAEVYDFLQRRLQQDYTLENIQLENMSMQEQLELFNSAALVIGQHGAGLGNVIWMPEGSKALEFGFRNRNHFKSLSETMGLDYLQMDYSEMHIEVAIASLNAALENLYNAEQQVFTF